MSIGIIACVNRHTWEREHSLKIRLWYGLVMVGLGAIMLVWVI